MIGIFRKDVFVLRKQLILIALSVVGFVTLALLICGSFRYGNLAKLPEKDYASVVHIKSLEGFSPCNIL